MRSMGHVCAHDKTQLYRLYIVDIYAVISLARACSTNGRSCRHLPGTAYAWYVISSLSIYRAPFAWKTPGHQGSSLFPERCLRVTQSFKVTSVGKDTLEAASHSKHLLYSFLPSQRIGYHWGTFCEETPTRGCSNFCWASVERRVFC